jgi:glycerophosphoryl diester phosphodiesterase
MENSLVEALHRSGYRDRKAPIFIQSFEVANLQALRQMTDLPLIQLINEVDKPYDFVISNDPRTYADLITEAGLKQIAGYADGIGPSKNLVIPRNASEYLTVPTRLVEWAHAAKLAVHPWTFRPENAFLPADYRSSAADGKPVAKETGDAIAEIRHFIESGIDGFFTDWSAAGKTAVQTVLQKR